MIHAVSSWRASLTRRLSPPGGQCGNLTGTHRESLRTHANTHNKTTCLLVEEYVSVQLHDIAHAPSLQPHRPTPLPLRIPLLAWWRAPTPQTRSGAANEQHSSKSRPFDRCKICRAAASLSQRRTVAATAPSESSRASCSDKTRETRLGKKWPGLIMMCPVPAVMDSVSAVGGEE